MNYGIVGLGKQGKQHLVALQVLSRLDSKINIFICDTNESYIKSLSKKLNIPYFLSCKKMLKSVDIDVLILALPNDKYKNILKLEELKNIHLIKEKPFATSYNEAQLFIDTLDQKKLFLMLYKIDFLPIIIILLKNG